MVQLQKKIISAEYVFGANFLWKMEMQWKILFEMFELKQYLWISMNIEYAA